MPDSDPRRDGTPDGDRDTESAARQLLRIAEEGYRRMLEIGRGAHARAAAADCEEFALVEDYSADTAVAIGIRIGIDDGEGEGEWLIACRDGRLLAGPVVPLRVDASRRWWSEPARERRVDGRRVLYVSGADWVQVSVSHPKAGTAHYPPAWVTSSAITVEIDTETGELTTNGFGDYTSRRLTDVVAEHITRITNPPPD